MIYLIHKKQANNILKKEVLIMANTEKMTNVKALYFVRDNYELPAEVAEKVNAMIASLEKKASNKKPTKNQEANEALKATILEVLTAEGATVSEIMKKIGDPDLSNQKISALLRQMVEDKVVVKTADKKRSLFSLPQ